MQLATTLKPTHTLDIVKPVPILYITMENDNDNLVDLTAYRLRNMIEDLAAVGQLDLADAIQDALDEYLLGNIDIAWRSGWPHMVLPEENDT